MYKKSGEIIDKLGGTVEVARMFNVTKGAVSQWRENGIPEARMMYLKLANPELFEQDAAANEEHRADPNRRTDNSPPHVMVEHRIGDRRDKAA
jgi:hypothetical protein